MGNSLGEAREFLHIAAESLGRYKLRTSLSVLGVVLGITAVIAMMSVSEGAAREALSQVQALGLDNLVARSHSSTSGYTNWRSLVASDADRVMAGVPGVRVSTPLIQRTATVTNGGKELTAVVLGVRQPFSSIMRLSLAGGRFVSASDDLQLARVCVLGGTLARQLFGFRNPVGERVRINREFFQVVGVQREQIEARGDSRSLAWHDFDRVVMMPFATLSQRSLAVAPGQPADEIWLQVQDGTRAEESGRIFQRVLASRTSEREFSIVVPRELLAQRYRTQRTFGIVVGSIAVLALLVGGIGIMNIMLTSVVERTHEIGVRRTVGATRRDVTLQFLVETLLMTVSGGAAGVVIGMVVSRAISAYAGWPTYISATAVALAIGVSFAVGLVFGIYPAIKAAALQPVDALRYE